MKGKSKDWYVQTTSAYKNVQVWYDHNNLRLRRQIYIRLISFFTIIQNNSILYGTNGIKCSAWNVLKKKLLLFIKNYITRRNVWNYSRYISRSVMCQKWICYPIKSEPCKYALRRLVSVCGVWYGLWPLVQYSSTMHFRFGSLHHVARAAARVPRPFLVARRLVAVVVGRIPATCSDYCVTRYVGYHRGFVLGPSTSLWALRQ